MAAISPKRVQTARRFKYGSAENHLALKSFGKSRKMAAHPYVAAYGDVARDWRKEKQREAQESSQQAPPSN
jgi:hypothetical protein